ncbi:MAG: putative inorganic carbon transporter subunit DabA, partial [Pseudomonadota bacterium]
MKADATNSANSTTDLVALTDAATRAIPPLWPLSSSVAVNPFMGQADQSLAEVSALMNRVAGMSMTMPHAWYCARMEDGSITDDDLRAALSADGSNLFDSLEALKAAAGGMDDSTSALPTIADLAADVSGIDWPGLIMDRIGTWAAGYFDAGQALWRVTPGRGAFESWRTFACRDLTPEIVGLIGFAEAVATTPGKAEPALMEACTVLDIDESSAPTYFHALLLGLGGWSQAARQRLWQAELAGETDSVTSDMLTIRLVWEQALYAHYQDAIASRWVEVRGAHGVPLKPEPAQVAATIFQSAAERAAQRALATTLAENGVDQSAGRPSLQAAFCIDVRSEVFRRALESLDPSIQTVGFAGFFGLTPAHRDFASDVVEARLPVLLNPALEST